MILKRFIFKLALFCTILFSSVIVCAQDDPFEIKQYSFIEYNLNEFYIVDSVSYNLLFEKLTHIGLKGEGKVSIVQIGDSHLQADLFSGYFRKKLQTFFLGAMGGRGYVFPYKVAQTNNPVNYSVTSKGQWESCRNVEKIKKCNLGLSGISVSTANMQSSVTISIDDPSLRGYDFDRLMVFHEFGNQSYSPVINNARIKSITPYPEKGYTLFEFEDNISSVTLNLKKMDSLQNSFDLYGFNFDSNDPGIIYHSIGVNGARFDSYLGCEYFVPHLNALEPDWIIISLGTNDVYTHVFDSIDFKDKVDSLIRLVKIAAPNAGILLTTPGDHRIRKEEINKNAKIGSAILKEKAILHSLSYWDFNSIMGGFGSIEYWRNTEMAHTDYLHYTQKGYEYQAQLMFNAFLKAYDDFLAQEILNK